MRGPIIGELELSTVAKAVAGIAIVAAIGLALTGLTLRRRMRTG
jgi:hypothetical protein